MYIMAVKIMKNKIKGSAMMWAVCVMAVALILISGVLGISQIYHNRTVDDTKKQQAEYTALSAISMVSDNIQKNDEWLSVLWDETINKPVEKIHIIENLSFTNADMGTVKLVFEWNTDEPEKFPYTMKLTSDAEYYGVSESISAEFEFNEEKEWKFIRYCE